MSTESGFAGACAPQLDEIYLRLGFFGSGTTPNITLPITLGPRILMRSAS